MGEQRRRFGLHISEADFLVLAGGAGTRFFGRERLRIVVSRTDCFAPCPFWPMRELGKRYCRARVHVDRSVDQCIRLKLLKLSELIFICCVGGVIAGKARVV